LKDNLNKKEFTTIKKLEIKTANDIFDFLLSYQKTIDSLINPKLFVI